MHTTAHTRKQMTETVNWSEEAGKVKWKKIDFLNIKVLIWTEICELSISKLQQSIIEL